jgi:hypothetical protein
MAAERQDWDGLTKAHSAPLVAALRRHLRSGPFEITSRELAAEVNVRDREAAAILEGLATDGVLSVSTRYRCPCDQARILSEDVAASEVCAHCNRAFSDLEAAPERFEVYHHVAPQTRDVRWVLALHGMNTRGAWQETFNWLLSRTYRHSVPVAIYKYGKIRPGVVIKFRQRVLVRQLCGRIRRLSADTEGSGFGGRPDVIAHSFGTWLLGHALRENPDVRVGRVVLTGCILRPDFDWCELIARQQVDAVLCHAATRDFWAGIAHYVIPDSGPSGRRGFNDRVNISHTALIGGSHSQFFQEGTLPILFEDVWQPFLTRPEGSPVDTSNALPEANWSQVVLPFRATLLRLCLLGLFALLCLTAMAAELLGLGDLLGVVFR